METLRRNEEKIMQLNTFMAVLDNAKNSQEKRAIFDKYHHLLESIEPMDIFYLEMYQDKTSLSIEEIKASAGKFVNVFANGLKKHYPRTYQSNLLTYLIKENRAIESHLNSLKTKLKKENFAESQKPLIKGFEQCLAFEIKFIKLENIIFPKIESKLPSTKPLEVLWSLHDDARRLIKKIITSIKQKDCDFDEISAFIGEYFFLIYGINLKEELILFPVADSLLTDEDKNVMYVESLTYGYSLIDDVPIPEKHDIKKIVYHQGLIKTATGYLNLKQLEALLNHLPLDITFVDDDDSVVYFNQRTQRHFPRNPSIIGRQVQHCHPPKSVDVVKKIIQAFKDNEKDEAEFWLNIKDTFLYIIYYAVRDDAGNYLGTLEVSQDVTKIRALEGENKLLNW